MGSVQSFRGGGAEIPDWKELKDYLSSVHLKEEDDCAVGSNKKWTIYNCLIV
jgi:hypothetical protein